MGGRPGTHLHAHEEGKGFLSSPPPSLFLFPLPLYFLSRSLSTSSPSPSLLPLPLPLYFLSHSLSTSELRVLPWRSSFSHFPLQL